MAAIVAKALVKHFSDEIRAVDGIDLDIPEGQVFGVLGQNGSGKSTTVRMLTTLLKPTSGAAFVGGVDVLAHPDEVRRGVGVAMQEVGLDEIQTGRELLTLQARLFGVPGGLARTRSGELLEVVGLTADADRPLRGYSGGMKRRLDLACALVHRPRIVFLDEPTTGLDPITRETMWRYVEDLNKGGVTFFLTTQYLEEADRLCHDIAIMDRGRIVASGSPGALKSSIGADAITVGLHDGEAAAKASDILRRYEGVASVHTVAKEVTVYLKNGAGAVAGIVLALTEAGVTVVDLRLSQATLDDVFLRATGHHLEANQAAPAGAASEGNS